jgi:hypothetical protein
MKIKTKTVTKNAKPKGTTTIKHLAVDGVVEISHHQSLRQVVKYQSAEVSYGVTMRLTDDPKTVQAGIRAAEKLVEEFIVPKFTEQSEALVSIAQRNEKLTQGI